MMQGVSVKLNPGLQGKATFNKKTTIFTSKLGFNFGKKLVKCYVLSTALYSVEVWTLR
jgi:hypothetical protein